jgi:hypothetical protein
VEIIERSQVARTILLMGAAILFSQAAIGNGTLSQTVPSERQVPSSKKMLLEVLETDQGVGGTNQFVFLRVFSNRAVEFHARQSQSLKKDRVIRGEISETQMKSVVGLLGDEDLQRLPRTFKTTYTPIDFYWTLDFKIPRGTQVQQVRLVNFYPAMAVQNHKPYPKALLRLACSVLALRRDLKAEASDQDEACKGFVSGE